MSYRKSRSIDKSESPSRKRRQWTEQLLLQLLIEEQRTHICTHTHTHKCVHIQQQTRTAIISGRDALKRYHVITVYHPELFSIFLTASPLLSLRRTLACIDVPLRDNEQGSEEQQRNKYTRNRNHKNHHHYYYLYALYSLSLSLSHSFHDHHPPRTLWWCSRHIWW